MSFIEKTRQNFMNLANLDYKSKQGVYVDIARVGFLATVKLIFNGKLTAKHASKTTFTKAPTAPYSIAERVKLMLNNGTALWDTSGWGAYLKNMIDKQEYKMDYALEGGSPAVFSFGNAVSATGAENDVNFSLNLPLSINDRDMIGLLLLQNDSTVLTLRIENADASALMTDTDIECELIGSWEVVIEYFSVPASVEDYPNLTRLHQVLESQRAITNTGENKMSLQRGKTYMRIINSLALDGKYVDEVNRIRLTYNLNTTPYDMSGAAMKVLQRERYGRDLPVGTYVHDFFYQGIPNLGNHRDFVYSGNVAEFDQFVNINSGAVMGANNNTLTMICDVLIDVDMTTV